MAKVYHSEIYGLREEKYEWLNTHNIKNVKWRKVVPYPEFYLFIPTDNKLANHYYSFYKITEIFPVNSVGIVTARDNFVIDFDRKNLELRIKQFFNPKVGEEILKQTYDLRENQSWKVKDQREKLRKDLDWKDSITKILYRPFDERWILYHDEMIERSRKEILQQLLHQNIALLIGRQSSVIGSDDYSIVFISEQIVDFNLYRRGGELVFPLYLYPQKVEKRKGSLVQMVMFETEVEYQTRQPNIKPELVVELNNVYFGHTPKSPLKRGLTPEEIFYYIYAVLYSNTYRKKYAEFLKIDFPRLPFTKDYNLFIKLGKLGQQLANLHLLKSKELEKTISKFPVDGSNKVEKPRFKYPSADRHGAQCSKGKVWINKEQYFDGVKEEVWQYQIGVYQVCEKWLKDRKTRTLTLDEIETYCKIVTSLSKTINLQNEIDKYFEKVEKTV